MNNGIPHSYQFDQTIPVLSVFFIFIKHCVSKQRRLCLHCFQAISHKMDAMQPTVHFETVRHLLLSADNVCKQFGSKPLDTLIVFLKEFSVKIIFE